MWTFGCLPTHLILSMWFLNAPLTMKPIDYTHGENHWNWGRIIWAGTIQRRSILWQTVWGGTIWGGTLQEGAIMEEIVWEGTFQEGTIRGWTMRARTVKRGLTGRSYKGWINMEIWTGQGRTIWGGTIRRNYVGRNYPWLENAISSALGFRMWGCRGWGCRVRGCRV